MTVKKYILLTSNQTTM